MPVRRVVLGNLLPVIAKVTFRGGGIVGALRDGARRGGLDLFQQGIAAPRCAIEDSCRVLSRRHRAKIAVELVRGDILRLIDLQQQVRRLPNDIGGRVGAEIRRAAPTDMQDVALLQVGYATQPVLIEPPHDALYGDKRLRLERRSRLDD